ncbi:MAG: PEP-CTERM sorting domain-containing protein [Terriglobales bacterium]
MKTSRNCALVLLTLLCSLAALADSLKDPQIIIKGAQGGGYARCPPEGCTPVGMKFTFTSPAKGEGKVFFTNASGKNWTSLRLIESGVPAANISCAQSLFLSCKIETLKDGKVEILLSGVQHKGGDNPRNGILAGSSFYIGFGCVKGVCWPKGGVTFDAQANVVPEPATIALVVTGVGLIGSRRKLWKNRWNA